jgi:hypothetical protein
MSTFTLDVTGSEYDALDVDLCTLFVPVPRALPAVLSFEMWGAIIKPSAPAVLSRLQGAVDFDLRKESAFLAGYGTFSVEGPQRLDLFVALYGLQGRSDFLRNQAGETIGLQQILGAPAEGAVEYNLGGTLAWPFGNCTLSVWATGRASLTFDPRACIPASQAMSNIEAHQPSERGR